MPLHYKPKKELNKKPSPLHVHQYTTACGAVAFLLGQTNSNITLPNLFRVQRNLRQMAIARDRPSSIGSTNQTHFPHHCKHRALLISQVNPNQNQFSWESRNIHSPTIIFGLTSSCSPCPRQATKSSGRIVLKRRTDLMYDLDRCCQWLLCRYKLRL